MRDAFLTFAKTCGLRCIRCALMALLLSASGCSLLVNEENGAKEPNIGEYRVTLSPPGASHVLPLSGFGPSVQIPLMLEAKCVGEAAFLPADCDSFAAYWSYNDQLAPWTLVELNNSVPAKTTAIIKPRNFLSDYQPGSLSGAKRKVEVIRFFPQQRPRDLILTGNRIFTIEYLFQTPVTEQNDPSASDPSLSVTSKGMHCAIAAGEQEARDDITIVYNGPATQLSISVSGPDAGSFLIETPTSFSLAESSALPLRIRYLATDSTPRNALVMIRTTNLRRPVLVQASGSRT